MNRLKALLLILLALLAGLYLYFWDHLPPRTAHKAARLISHLDIPSRAKVERFEDHWNLMGNGITTVVLQLTDQDISFLKEHCLRSGYKPYISDARYELPLPVENIPKGERTLFSWVRPPKTYSDYAIVVLDQTNRRLIVYSIVG